MRRFDVYCYDMRTIAVFMLILIVGCDDPESASPSALAAEEVSAMPAEEPASESLEPASQSSEPVLSSMERKQLLRTMAEEVVMKIGGMITHTWFEDQAIVLDEPLPDGTSLRCVVGFRPADMEPAQPGEMNTSHTALVTLTKNRDKWSPTRVEIQGESLGLHENTLDSGKVIEGDELQILLYGDGG